MNLTSLTSSLTVTPLLYALAASLLLSLGLGAWGAYEKHEATVARKARDEAVQAEALAKADNKVDVDAFDQVNAELKTCVGVKAAEAETIMALNDQAADRETKLKAATSAAAVARKVIYAAPACASLALPICPDAESELRARRAQLNGVHAP